MSMMSGGVDDYPGRMLQQAAIYNNTDFLASLLEGEEAGNVDAQDIYGRTALYTSVTNNSLECARMLLNSSANPNISCGTQCGCMTPLHAAALDDKHQFVRLLLEHGADYNVVDASGKTPLELANKNRSQETAKIIEEEIASNKNSLQAPKLRRSSATRIARKENRRSRKRALADRFVEACENGNVMDAQEVGDYMTDADRISLINHIPDGANSLLYRVCEQGSLEMVQFLISQGAEGLAHPISGMSPLHAAVQAGHTQVIMAILKNFPELIQTPTIDGTLPQHMAVSLGNLEVVKTLLHFPYPDNVRHIERDQTGHQLYRLGFRFNARDGRGQTILHVAAFGNKIEILRLLLNFSVKPWKKDMPSSNSSSRFSLKSFLFGQSETADLESPDCREATEDFPQGDGHVNEVTILPAEVDARDLDGHTPLHIAIMGDGAHGYHEVAEMLLRKGADPNKPFISSSGNTTALMEACERGDVTMMNSLLKHKALDTDHKVLSAAVLSHHHSMISTLLKYNAYSDSEYKINKHTIIQLASGSEDVPDGFDSSCLPCTPVVINWYGLGLQEINCGWLLQASLMHNLNIAPAQAKLALEVITRIDISNNHLATLPHEVFSLKSLKLLNASENLISNLESGLKEDQETDCTLVQGWDAPWLEEIHLHKNRLKQLPPQLFHLPRLQRLIVSQNELETVPYSMWTSPFLIDLNMSHNKLKNLPLVCDHVLPLVNESQGDMDGALSDASSTTPTRATPGSVESEGPTPKSGSLNSCGTPTDNQIETPSTESGEGSKSFRDMPVNRHVHWSSRVLVQNLPLDSDPAGKGKRSVLSELNLSHNLFETVPAGLSCLAPQLSKLILSSNKLPCIGPLGLFPVGLRWLDLSYNFITGSSEPKVDEEQGVWTCFNPPQHSGRSRQRNASSPALRGPGGRASSSPSLSSMVPPSATLAPGPCIHQAHTHLDQLKTLKLNHNRLVSLCVSHERIVSITEASSLDEANKSPSRTRRASNIVGDKVAALFYPSLTVLDVGHNALTTLPVELSVMIQLTELKLPHNKVKELPPELGLLRKLWNLDVGDNPVEKMLIGMLGDKAKKTAAVLGYLKSIKEEATLYNRMKLMFVGVQGIGKTSLLAQLRKEGKSSSSKNKNWAQRMGHGTIKDKDLKGDNISTVGVDIGDLILARGNREIIFKTWDFGGQREYYATHQYFLTKRSLYLVMWKVTDGEKGVNDIMQWLVNIQARAPNAPVIIVATHLDQVTKRKYPATYLQDLQHLIRAKYMSHSEPEKWGLPRVLHHIEITCRPKLMSNSHIGELVNLIFTVACEEQMPGSKGVRLIEQKVPATYVQLQDVVYELAAERKIDGKDPVLHSEQYRPCVMSKMEEKFQTSFRDVAELNQATQFLHENGVLLHYDDVNLQDVYFLDPQWLCDMLANVVTIREINSLAKFGIMKTDDLRILFKNAAFKPEDIKTYIIDLLNKFEVALLWDDRNLLIPSLLPTEEQVKRRLPQTDVRIPVRGAHVSEYNPRFGNHLPVILNGPETSRLPPQPREEGHSTFYLDHGDYQSEEPHQDMRTESEETLSRDGTTSDFSSHASSSEDDKTIMPRIAANPNPAVALCRLYLMSYFPSGFWPRLITRLLGDDTIFNIILSMYDLPDVVTENDHFMQHCGTCPEWKCWQTGMELRYLGVPILSLKEASNIHPGSFCDYRKCKLVIRQEQDIDWTPLNLTSTSVLELLIPNETLTVHIDTDRPDGGSSGFDESVVLQPVPQATASLVAKMVDHIDTLLEDWYPDLGARFIQNSRGMYLITRIVPCVRCLLQQKRLQDEQHQGPDAWSMVDMSPGDNNACITQPIMIDQQQQQLPLLAPSSLGSTASSQGEPSPVISQLSPGSTWSSSVYTSSRMVLETVENIYNKTASATGLLPRIDRSQSPDGLPGEGSADQIYCYLVEQCLQAAQLNRVIFCPEHGNLGPYFIASHCGQVQAAHAAPDAVFQDIGDQYVIESDHVTRGRFLGKGSFGAVFAGTMTDKRTGNMVEIAMKMLQPMDPGPEASPSHCQQYQAEKQRWDKEPMKNACEAYLNARKELTILLSLHHENIVPLLGICLQPLCLILSLAPLGSLNDRLKEHRRAGARLQPHTIQQIIIQTASALGYLHSCRIIYRDLKSENILVWRLPSPHSAETVPIDVKLADYGVSRAVLPSGAKGFAGTPPFIAPEIIQHSGEEAYTEKVDCFSFGMFIYELMMLKLPFEDGEGGGAVVANLKGHILGGGRPAISPKELTYPACLLDLMTLCWGHDPSERPSANEIEQIARTAEFAHLQDVVALENENDLGENENDLGVLCACSAPYRADLLYELEDSEEASFVDVWLSVKSGKSQGNQGQLLTFTFRKQQCLGSRSLDIEEGVTIGCICLVDKWLWCGDTSGIVHIYSPTDYTQVLKFSATSKPNLRIKTMVHASAEKQVYIVMDTGSLVVCDAELPPSWGVNFTPVRMECPGNRKRIHCITVIPASVRSSVLWCGQGKAKISVWNLSSTKGSVTTLSHGLESEMDNKNVLSITSEKENPHSVWSYLYPGSEVFRWDAHNHNIVGRLDVSLAIPEMDRSSVELTLEGTLEESKCHVTSLCALEDKLYIGTSWGCMVVCHATQMQMISVMRIHGEDWPNTQIILPLSIQGVFGDLQEENAGIVSIGRGYRDVIERYIKVYESRIPAALSSMYLLSWNTKKWSL